MAQAILSRCLALPPEKLTGMYASRPLRKVNSVLWLVTALVAPLAGGSPDGSGVARLALASSVRGSVDTGRVAPELWGHAAVVSSAGFLQELQGGSQQPVTSSTSSAQASFTGLRVLIVLLLVVLVGTVAFLLLKRTEPAGPGERGQPRTSIVLELQRLSGQAFRHSQPDLSPVSATAKYSVQRDDAAVKRRSHGSLDEAPPKRASLLPGIHTATRSSSTVGRGSRKSVTGMSFGASAALPHDQGERAIVPETAARKSLLDTSNARQSLHQLLDGLVDTLKGDASSARTGGPTTDSERSRSDSRKRSIITQRQSYSRERSNSGLLRKRVSFAEDVAPAALPVEPDLKSAADLSDTDSSSSDADAGDLDLIYNDLPATDDGFLHLEDANGRKTVTSWYVGQPEASKGDMRKTLSDWYENEKGEAVESSSFASLMVTTFSMAEEAKSFAMSEDRSSIAGSNCDYDEFEEAYGNNQKRVSIALARNASQVEQTPEILKLWPVQSRVFSVVMKRHATVVGPSSNTEHKESRISVEFVDDGVVLDVEVSDLIDPNLRNVWSACEELAGSTSNSLTAMAKVLETAVETIGNEDLQNLLSIHPEADALAPTVLHQSPDLTLIYERLPAGFVSCPFTYGLPGVTVTFVGEAMKVFYRRDGVLSRAAENTSSMCVLEADAILHVENTCPFVAHTLSLFTGDLTSKMPQRTMWCSLEDESLKEVPFSPMGFVVNSAKLLRSANPAAFQNLVAKVPAIKEALGL
uniref:Uncharacterized protein n=1 Tax=Noctiluca scintillans TaxID=2966 RepID=A0A7S1A688_NOCSC